MLLSHRRAHSVYRRFGKRILDLLVVVPALILLAPVYALLALLVRARLGRPILFRQERPGRGGRPFVLLKLRTMREPSELDAESSDAARLTPLGRFLRRTSLDELPELWNILRGEMSLVGPRPLLTEYLERYSPTQARRHEVRPGITGWAQVHGRNTLDWEEKFRRDVWYVDHLSLALDVKILAMTAWKIVTGEGISAPGHATMPRFRGGDER